MVLFVVVVVPIGGGTAGVVVLSVVVVVELGGALLQAESSMAVPSHAAPASRRSPDFMFVIAISYGVVVVVV
ncbi:hypothetical protein [Acidocella sp.]|uniref:hypothetical protein n=1 Tax=Acidocella sp. TaxID=50710 RepID=UPI00262D9496|nr:hypothetical protein [Acidocella sp.]